MESCVHCGATPVTPPACWKCGKHPEGGGGNFLALLAWLFIPFSIPVYPILGSLGTGAMVAVAWLTATFGVYGGFRIIAIAVAGYVAMFLFTPIERAASRSKAYRAARMTIRVLVCAVLIIALLNAPERDLPRGAALALALIGVPLVFLAARRFDRVLGFLGPPKVADAPAGDPVAPAPVLEPDDAPPAASSEGSEPAGRKVPRVLRATILGGVLGTVGGAVLLASSGSGHVEADDVIAFTIIGLVLGLIIGLVRRALARR